MPDLTLEKTARGERARIEQLIARQEAYIRRAFREFLDDMRSEAVLREVRTALEQSGVGAALQIIDSYVARLGLAAPAVFRAVGAAEAAALSRRMRAARAGVAVMFDPTDPRAVTVQRRNQLEFVQQFTVQQRAATRAALVEALQTGAGTVETARAFRDSIGLTEYQRQTVARYRRLLEQGDAAALDRELRDRRFDPSVRAAVEDGEPLGARRIARMVERYRARLLQMRAETIARTETASAVGLARDQALTQVSERTGMTEDNIVQTWRATRDRRTRDTHAMMDGQQRRRGQAFESPSGARMMFPGDSSLGAPASEIINCRCVLVTEFKFS